MNTVCDVNMCAGCMACVDICPRRAISVVDDMEHMNAIIDLSLCINCNACHKICQNNNPPILKKPKNGFKDGVMNRPVVRVRQADLDRKLCGLCCVVAVL